MASAPAVPRAAPMAVVIVLVLLAPVLSGCAGNGPGLFYNPGEQGKWARDFLSDAKYSRLIVELDYQNGGKPEDNTVNRLQSVMESYLKKPRGIEIRQSADISGGGQGTKYTFDKIRDLEDDSRDHYKGGDDAVLYIQFVNAGSSEDTGDARVLGAAYSGSSIVMFKDNIRQAAQNCGSPLGFGCPSISKVEEAVMIHELGHILGLVNNGIPMVTPHEDTGHKGHSSNEDSVMYWKVDSGNIVDLFTGGGIPTQFDANDRQDMCKAGGKC